MTHSGLTRRDVILAGATAASSVVLAAPLARTATATQSPLRRATYAALSDRTFRIRRGGVVRTIALREIADLPRAATLAKYRGSDDAFGLTFDGPPGGEQGTYTFAHPTIGRFAMFITPVGRPSKLQTYEAVIDRLYRPTARHPAPA
jgi:hypothetical protein